MADDRHDPLCILCVDDDPDIGLIVQLSLHLDPEINAVVVADPAEAMNELENCKFDLILLDGLMAEFDGLDLLDHIIKLDGSPPTPVIFLTADAMRRTRYERPGVLGVILKPFDPLALADEVRSILRHVGTNTVPEQ